MIGYAIGTLSELLKSEHMQSHLKDIENFGLSPEKLSKRDIDFVYNFLNIASCDP